MTTNAYRGIGIFLGALVLLLAFTGHVATTVQHHPIAGVAMFAVLYVIAPAVERVVEFVVAMLNLLPNSPGKRKEEGLRTIGAANSTLNGNPTEDDFAATTDVKAAAEENVDEARKDIAFVGLGLSLLLAVLAVNHLNYGMLSSIGTTGVDGDIDRLLTALAAAGGSKGLHELVGRMQKAKEESEASAKTA